MARTVDLLVGTEEPVSAVTAAIDGPHHFDDGDLHKPDGTPLPLRSQYRHWVEVRDLDRDPDRQLATST